jgi:hypothetical protein
LRASTKIMITPNKTLGILSSLALYYEHCIIMYVRIGFESWTFHLFTIYFLLTFIHFKCKTLATKLLEKEIII